MSDTGLTDGGDGSCYHVRVTIHTWSEGRLARRSPRVYGDRLRFNRFAPVFSFPASPCAAAEKAGRGEHSLSQLGRKRFEGVSQFWNTQQKKEHGSKN